jgi:hypothetical protein
MLPDCPICKNAKSVRQAHKRSLDALWCFFGWFAYRCDGCTARFYRFAKPKSNVTNTQ